MDRCTGHHDITEILLKTALNIQSINQPLESASYSLFRTIPIFPLIEENLKKAKRFGQFQYVLAEVDEHYANTH